MDEEKATSAVGSFDESKECEGVKNGWIIERKHQQ
jgi:hypothetical protein